MSETTKMTKEEILEIFRSEYNSLLRHYERRVEKFTLKMNEDFEYFFRWYGQDMYISQVNLTSIRELRLIASWDDLEKVKTWLGDLIENIERTLVEGSQYPSSSSIMANVAETLKRVAQQELRGELQRLLWAITCNE